MRSIPAAASSEDGGFAACCLLVQPSTALGGSFTERRPSKLSRAPGEMAKQNMPRAFLRISRIALVVGLVLFAQAAFSLEPNVSARALEAAQRPPHVARAAPHRTAELHRVPLFALRHPPPPTSITQQHPNNNRCARR